MTIGNRIEVLKDTLRRIAEFATILTPEGISIRLLNYEQDETGDYDNLRTVEQIERLIDRIRFENGTPLGTVLDRKIVQPLILKKAENGTLKKPLIVVTITDGEPNHERGHSFQDAILKCRRSTALQSYGDAAVVFIVSRVGNSPAAQDFIAGIRQKRS